MRNQVSSRSCGQTIGAQLARGTALLALTLPGWATAPAPVAVPTQVNTPPLIAIGHGLLPKQIDTAALVAIGQGLLPKQIDTAALVASGSGLLPLVINTALLAAAGSGMLPGQVNTPPLIARLQREPVPEGKPPNALPAVIIPARQTPITKPLLVPPK